jgi:TRAP-type C4-dicarboxylate transport system substrate-binding protein
MGTNKKLGMAFGILILAGILLLQTNAALAGTTWKGYTYNSSIVNAGAAGMVKIGKEVEKETNGDLKIQVHLGGSLPIKATNITQAVADGVIQFAADGFFLGNITIGGVLRLPMLLTNIDDYMKAVEIMKPYLDRDFAKQGVLVLGRYHYPLQVSWSIKRLTCLADMAGQKMRVTSPEQGEYVKRFGAFPVTIGAPEVASALQR